MEVRERMGTSVRTVVKVKVTTDGDQHQDGECDYRSMGDEDGDEFVRTRVTTCAVMV